MRGEINNKTPIYMHEKYQLFCHFKNVNLNNMTFI